MKKNILSVGALSAFLIVAGVAFAQTQSGNAGNNASAAPRQQKLLKIAELNGADANREFQANVQLVQAQRQAALDLNAALEKEKDPEKKKKLKADFDAVMVKLNDNNAAMLKAYGFSITRNYTLEIEKSSIWMFVTDEEAAKIEQEQKAAAQAPKATDKAASKSGQKSRK